MVDSLYLHLKKNAHEMWISLQNGAKTGDRTRDLALHYYPLFIYREGLDCIFFSKKMRNPCQSFERL